METPTPQLTNVEGEVKPLASPESRRERYRKQIIEAQKDVEKSFADFLLEKRRYFRTVDEPSRRKHVQDIDLMIRYVSGDQYGDYDEEGNYIDQRRDGDYAYSIPVINGHVEQAFMQLLKTNIQYNMNAKNKAKHSDLARMCETVAIEEKDRLMTEDAQMDEIQNTILAGESYRCLIWGINPDNPKVAKRVKHAEETIEIAGYRQCQACKREVPEGVESCECGATYIKNIPGASAKRFKAEPAREVRLGENILHIPYPTAVQRDLGALKFRQSTFIVERDYLRKDVAEWMYQTVIETDSEALPEEIRLRQVQERSSTQTDAIANSSREMALTQGPAQQVVREHIYMDVSEYGSFYFSKDEILPDGTKIKAGTISGDKYPNGLYVLFVGRTVIKIKALNKNRRWSVVLYNKRAGSGRGVGLQTGIPLQDAINDSFNQEFSVGMAGHPFTVAVRQYVKQIPELNNLLFLDKVPPQGVESVIKRYPGQAPTGYLGATAERIESAMQFILGTYTLAPGGAADQKAVGTATGVAAMTENAFGRMTGPIRQRVYADKELMFQCLENIRDYSADEQKRELVERFGPDVCEMFFTCNFRQVLTITVAPNTDTPRSMALTQANMMALGQLSAGLAKVPWGQELLMVMADTLGVSLSIGEGRSDRREAEYRLNKLAAIEARIAEKNPNFLTNTQRSAQLMYEKLEEFCGLLSQDAAQSEEEQAAFMFMQDHTSFMDAYKDAIFGEEARTWSTPRKVVVVQMWLNHYKASLAQKFKQAEMMRELQGEVEPQPEPEQLAREQQEQDKRALTGLAIQHQAEQEAKDADLQREQAGRDADLHRDLTRQEHGALTQIAVEQAKAAMQPGNGATQ